MEQITLVLNVHGNEAGYISMDKRTASELLGKLKKILQKEPYVKLYIENLACYGAEKFHPNGKKDNINTIKMLLRRISEVMKIEYFIQSIQ